MKKEVICGIYKITSPTGKIYIGESSDIYKWRYNKYRIGNCKTQIRIYNSLKKHGWDAHAFEIIEKCEFDELKCRERHWQDLYDVTGKNGLNCVLTECGEIKKSYSEETLERMREGQKGEKNGNFGNKWTQEQKDIASAKFKGENNPNFGIKRSQETCDRISKAKKGYTHSEEAIQKMRDADRAEGGDHHNSKEVINTVDLKIYPYVGDACKILGIKESTLTSYLSGNRRNPTTFIYLENYVEGMGVKEPEVLLKQYRREVIDIKTLIVYKSITEVAKSLGLGTKLLNMYLNGKRQNKTSMTFYIPELHEHLLKKG